MNAIVAAPFPFVPAPRGLLADLGLPCDPSRPYVTPVDLGLGDRASPVGCHRVRTPVPQVLRSEKLTGGSYLSMCLLETASLLHLLCDPSVVRVVPRAHVLVRPDGNGGERFVPDAVVRRRDGTVEAFSFRFSWERDKAAEHGLRRAYRWCGVGYAVLTERRRTFLPLGRSNRLALLHTRVAEGRAQDVAKVHEALDRVGLPTTVEKVRRRARFPAGGGLARTLPCLFELARSGEIALDLDGPLGGNTAVRRGPCA